MTCPLENQETAVLLLTYSSDRMSADSAAPLQRHVESCPACQRFLAQQAEVWDALDLWKPEPVTADFDSRLYQKIERQVSWREMFLRPFRPLFAARGLPIAAAAGLVIMAAVLLDRPAAAPPAPVPVSAQVETLQPDQVEHALDEVEMLHAFNHLMRSDPSDSNSKM